MTTPIARRVGSVAAALLLTAGAASCSQPAHTTLDVNHAQVPAGTGEAITGSATFTVGTDVLPGRWTTTAESSCYWARLSTTDAMPGAVLDSGRGHGTTGVVIEATDAAFVSVGCGTWRRTPGGNTTTGDQR